MSKIYPAHTGGRFRNLKNVISVTLQALLFITPWIRISGRPLVLMDLQGRKLHLLGATFWPHDTHLLLLLVLAAGITLFLVSSVLGRIWCGFACPHTLFSHSFILVERWIEGDAPARMRLDRSAWQRRLPKKLAKMSIWLAMSVYLGLTFAGYFAPIDQVVRQMIGGTLTSFSAGLIGFFTLVSMVFFGVIRSRFCTTICPYARFQAAMTGPETRMVNYDVERGEPRGKVADPEANDCVDCKACVRVCPMGIDIRDGFQFSCINCASCIDACDDIMTKVDRPQGLVRFTSLAELQDTRGSQDLDARAWLKSLGLRPFIYIGILGAVLALLLGLTWTRPPFDFDLVRDSRTSAAVRAVDGSSSNRYILRVINRRNQSESVRVTLSQAPDGAELILPENPVELAPESVTTLPVVVVCPARERAGVEPIRMLLVSSLAQREKAATFLFGGSHGPR